MTDYEKAHDLIDDLSWVMDNKTYRHFLSEYDRLCRQNEVGRADVHES